MAEAWCKKCRGTGTYDGAACTRCNGIGARREQSREVRALGARCCTKRVLDLRDPALKDHALMWCNTCWSFVDFGEMRGTQL